MTGVRPKAHPLLKHPALPVYGAWNGPGTIPAEFDLLMKITSTTIYAGPSRASVLLSILVTGLAVVRAWNRQWGQIYIVDNSIKILHR